MLFTERDALLLRLKQLEDLEEKQLEQIQLEKEAILKRLGTDQTDIRMVQKFVEDLLQNNTSALSSKELKEAVSHKFGSKWTEDFPGFMKTIMSNNVRVVRPYRGHYYYHQDD
ncbi:hypothetical protein [Mangrovibacillus cuniculi]